MIGERPDPQARSQALHLRGTRRVAVGDGRRGRHRRARGHRRGHHRRHHRRPREPDGAPAHRVEEPTIKMRFGVNTSRSRQVGKFLTSRATCASASTSARPERNLAMRVEPTESPISSLVFGRGELMLSILVETMRREGYELRSATPRSSRARRSTAEALRAVERVVVDVPDEYVGVVTRAPRPAPRPHEQDDEPRLRPRAHGVPRCPRAASSASAASSSPRRAAPACSTRSSTAGSRGRAR
jgi:predicted membrane GTPase involved in stress response